VVVVVCGSDDVPVALNNSSQVVLSEGPSVEKFWSSVKVKVKLPVSQ
jgi:hypothetical protein